MQIDVVMRAVGIAISLLAGAACAGDGVILWQEDFEGCGPELCGWKPDDDGVLTIVETFHPGEHALGFEEAGVASLEIPVVTSGCELRVSLVTPCYSGYDNREARSRIPEVTFRGDAMVVTLAPGTGSYINAWFEDFETTVTAPVVSSVEIVSLTGGCAIDHLQLTAPAECPP